MTQMTTHPTDAEIAEIELRLKQYGWTEGFMSLCAAARDRNRLADECARLREALWPFANVAKFIPPGWEDRHGLEEWALSLDVGDIRLAENTFITTGDRQWLMQSKLRRLRSGMLIWRPPSRKRNTGA